MSVIPNKLYISNDTNERYFLTRVSDWPKNSKPRGIFISNYTCFLEEAEVKK